jgi:holin-like protein
MMLGALATLLLAQLAGEVVARALGLPIPGPVLGMIFLLVAVSLRRTLLAALDLVAGTLLEHLSLLFVPAGVGVMRYGAILRAHGIALATALIVSTVLGMTVTALVLVAFERRTRIA